MLITFNQTIIRLGNLNYLCSSTCDIHGNPNLTAAQTLEHPELLYNYMHSIQIDQHLIQLKLVFSRYIIKKNFFVNVNALQ